MVGSPLAPCSTKWTVTSWSSVPPRWSSAVTWNEVVGLARSWSAVGAQVTRPVGVIPRPAGSWPPAGSGAKP